MAQVIKPFLDANVLFTAAYNPKGLAAMLINRAKALKLHLRSSRYACHEARHNLSLKAPQASIDFEDLLKFVTLFDPLISDEPNPLALPLDDIAIYQGALLTESTHLLSGDLKAFGKWMNQPKKTQGLVIQTIRQFVDANLMT